MLKLFKGYDAVLYDLDGVITDTARFHFQGWKKLADELGILFTEKDNENLKGVDRMGSLEYILKLGQIDVSIEEKAALAARKNTYYQGLIEQIGERDILPGVVSQLESLKSLDKKVGLASASQNATNIITKLGLESYFNHIANAQIARSKPAPDIFLFAAYGVGVHPRKCIGLEDSIAGLQSIKACSMFAIGVGGQELAEHADYHVSNLSA